jgi:predicted nucleic acid-binding protein
LWGNLRKSILTAGGGAFSAARLPDCRGRSYADFVKIFVETTIPSYLVAGPSRDIVQTARQQITREWWERSRGKHELFTSQIVLDEAGAEDAVLSRARLELLAPLPLLEISETVLDFAGKILDAGILPPDADRDAAHIATATIHGLDAMLSLNFRHLVNVSIQSRLRRLALGAGYDLPAICTPEELMENI